MSIELPLAGPAIACQVLDNVRPLGGCWRERSEVYTCGAEEANDAGLCSEHLAELRAASAADLEGAVT